MATAEEAAAINETATAAMGATALNNFTTTPISITAALIDITTAPIENITAAPVKDTITAAAEDTATIVDLDDYSFEVKIKELSDTCPVIKSEQHGEFTFEYVYNQG